MRDSRRTGRVRARIRGSARRRPRTRVKSEAKLAADLLRRLAAHSSQIAARISPDVHGVVEPADRCRGPSRPRSRSPRRAGPGGGQGRRRGPARRSSLGVVDTVRSARAMTSAPPRTVGQEAVVHPLRRSICREELPTCRMNGIPRSAIAAEPDHARDGRANARPARRGDPNGAQAVVGGEGDLLHGAVGIVEWGDGDTDQPAIVCAEGGHGAVMRPGDSIAVGGRGLEGRPGAEQRTPPGRRSRAGRAQACAPRR